jgi:glycolate oxidase iron-sulfur subunit
VKDYADLLKHDAEYAEKAARVSELTRDLSELLPELLPRLRGKVKACDKPALAFHPPCTLQHGQKLRGVVEEHLGQLGFSVHRASVESHLCCGSAGTYPFCSPKFHSSSETARSSI